MVSARFRLGLVALVVGGVGACASPTASGLAAGACVDLPESGAVTAAMAATCVAPHDAEVFWSGKLEGFTDLPSTEQVRTFSAATCAPALVTYSGIDIFSDATYDVGWFSPTADGWKTGDRSLTCYVYRVDGAKMTAPVKKG